MMDRRALSTLQPKRWEALCEIDINELFCPRVLQDSRAAVQGCRLAFLLQLRPLFLRIPVVQGNEVARCFFATMDLALARELLAWHLAGRDVNDGTGAILEALVGLAQHHNRLSVQVRHPFRCAVDAFVTNGPAGAKKDLIIDEDLFQWELRLLSSHDTSRNTRNTCNKNTSRAAAVATIVTSAMCHC